MRDVLVLAGWGLLYLGFVLDAIPADFDCAGAGVWVEPVVQWAGRKHASLTRFRVVIALLICFIIGGLLSSFLIHGGLGVTAGRRDLLHKSEQRIEQFQGWVSEQIFGPEETGDAEDAHND